ncbi:hypothetical protein GCM10009790_40440 [Georgenia ruanii]|uniref:DUF4190 domain-containing protein n=1 Tax=Georgenia ruanii TaxID=348442 RepID=UPI0031CF8ECF
MSDNLPGNDRNSNPVPPPPAPSGTPNAHTPNAHTAPSAPAYDPAATNPGAPAYSGGPAQPKGLALSSMIVGIVSLLISWPVSIVGIIGGVVALVLGIVARKKGQPKGMALTGIITGALAIVISIIAMIFVALVIGAALNDPNLQQQLEQLDQ